MNLNNKFDKNFYKTIFAVALPIMIQNGITNFVSLLDNIMVGRLGTEFMSGTSVVNQLIFVFNLCIFGVLSGPGIFGAQFFGSGSSEGVRNVFRFKIVITTIILLAGMTVLSLFGDRLISLYLTGNGTEGDRELILASGHDYLRIMLWGLIPFAITQAYASTLRETNCTVLPMTAGIISVLINLVLDWLLIFGNFGFPKMGVKGAALATVTARLAECAIVMIYTHARSGKHQFIKGAFRSMKIPAELAKKIFIGGLPLAFNESLWAAGMAFLTQCYSRRGLDVVAAKNIESTLFNLFSVVFIALGNAVGIIVGQTLGSGDMKKANSTASKLIVFSAFTGVVTGGIMVSLSGIFPDLYVTTPEVKHLAASLIIISGSFIPVQSVLNAVYFTIRSGGRTFITFLFDSVYTWTITVPLALALVKFTSLNILMIFFICQAIDIIKITVGIILVKKGIWLRNIVSAPNAEK